MGIFTMGFTKIRRLKVKNNSLRRSDSQNVDGRSQVFPECKGYNGMYDTNKKVNEK